MTASVTAGLLTAPPSTAPAGDGTLGPDPCQASNLQAGAIRDHYSRASGTQVHHGVPPGW